MTKCTPELANSDGDDGVLSLWWCSDFRNAPSLKKKVCQDASKKDNINNKLQS